MSEKWIATLGACSQAADYTQSDWRYRAVVYLTIEGGLSDLDPSAPPLAARRR
jgi:hypothetical protein